MYISICTYGQQADVYMYMVRARAGSPGAIREVASFETTTVALTE